MILMIAENGSNKTCKIVIEVDDLNDNAPLMSKRYFHFISSKSNKTVGQINAYDLDSGINAQIRYQFEQCYTPFNVCFLYFC